MKQEAKDLLLRDLCARLPYGVKLYANYVDGINTKEGKGRLSMIDNDMVVAFIDETENTYSFTYVALCEVKPYLFPMSSMTKEQIDEIYIDSRVKADGYDILDSLMNDIDAIDWLNANHFDYRGLIEKGLALDATGLNIY